MSSFCVTFPHTKSGNIFSGFFAWGRSQTVTLGALQFGDSLAAGTVCFEPDNIAPIFACTEPTIGAGDLSDLCGASDYLVACRRVGDLWSALRQKRDNR